MKCIKASTQNLQKKIPKPTPIVYPQASLDKLHPAI